MRNQARIHEHRGIYNDKVKKHTNPVVSPKEGEEGKINQAFWSADDSEGGIPNERREKGREKR